MDIKSKKILIYSPTLEGGVGKVVINLAKGLKEKKLDIKLIVNYIDSKRKFDLENENNISIISLGSVKTSRIIKAYIKFLKTYKPDIIISNIFHANLLTLLIKKFWGIKSKIIICEHISLNEAFKSINLFKRIIIKIMIKILYPTADYVVGVSDGISEEIKIFLINYRKIKTIYNPIIEDSIFKKAQEKINHPWFTDDKKYKIILGIGRLTPQKSFEDLIRAFCLVRKKIDAKLVILGEGEERKKLENLIAKLDLKADVDLVGFVENPYPYLKRADVFVLSSKYEGLPTVLIEALAFGLPIVSTNCPTGPQEILENGKYGFLVPVGNYELMAEKILDALKSKDIDKEALKKQAMKFKIEERVEDYLKLINSLL